MITYYLIATWFIGFIWFSVLYKDFEYPIFTILLGTFLSPILIPLRIIFKILL